MAKKKPAASQTSGEKSLTIRPLKQTTMKFLLTGLAPLMLCRFSEKAKAKMMATQSGGSTSKSKKNREPRDFDADYEGAMYRLKDGSPGMAASSFRCAMISACRTVGFKMTLAKLSLFTIADGLDVIDGTPLVRINGTHERSIMPVRNQTGVCDLRARPLWREWSIDLRVRFDGDQFTDEDIFNLLRRAGMQVGVGEGRPDSKSSAGIGYGIFDVAVVSGVEEEV